jgi:hypothetical protein
MTVDEMVYEGLDFIRAHPKSTAKRVEDHLWAVIDGDADLVREDVRRLSTASEASLLMRMIRRLYYGGRVKRAMKELNAHLSAEGKRAKRRRAEGRE